MAAAANEVSDLVPRCMVVAGHRREGTAVLEGSVVVAEEAEAAAAQIVGCYPDSILGLPCWHASSPPTMLSAVGASLRFA